MNSTGKYGVDAYKAKQQAGADAGAAAGETITEELTFGGEAENAGANMASVTTDQLVDPDELFVLLIDQGVSAKQAQAICDVYRSDKTEIADKILISQAAQGAN